MSELGTKLRDARIEKGYTLNTLQQMTKIQKKYLQAIEEGNYDEMPGSFYVRAFVKQYADMVGLDGDALLEQYGDELVTNTSDDNMQNRPADDDIPSRVERHEAKEKNNIDIILSYLPLVLLIAIIIAIMVALILAIRSINEVDEPDDSVAVETTNVISLVEPETATIEETEEIEPEEESDPAPTLGENDIRVGDQVLTLVSEPGEETTYQLNAPFSEYEFEVEGNAFVWIGVFEDGAIVQDITVEEGESITHEAAPGTENLRITLGYADGASFLVNGVEVEPQGEFLRETIVFIASGDNALSDNDTQSEPVETEEETIELELPETENTEEGFQGPAVLNPANTNDGTE